MAVFTGRTGTEACKANRLQTRIFKNGGVGQGGQSGRVVDQQDGDGKGVGDRVNPTIGGAAVVFDHHSDGCRAELVGQRREGQCACSCRICVIDGGIGDERWIAGDGSDAEGLGAFVGGSWTQAGEVHGLKRAVLENGNIGQSGQGGRVVDRQDGDGERVCYRVNASISGAAVVFDHHGDRGDAELVGQRREGQSAVGCRICVIDRWIGNQTRTA